MDDPKAWDCEAVHAICLRLDALTTRLARAIRDEQVTHEKARRDKQAARAVTLAAIVALAEARVELTRAVELQLDYRILHESTAEEA